ncbi:hypothetical protein [Longimicrobium sp.]|jgi:hypothetical protein|uniref:hypothetical protein n=1 Tax=Longimicrobium sp. TaxID=2029185 RepID=UPI002ED85F09
MADAADWQTLRPHLVDYVKAARSSRAVADEIGISHTGLRAIVENDGRVPFPGTQQKVATFLRRKGFEVEAFPEEGALDSGTGSSAAEDRPEADVEDVLRYFAGENPEMFRMLEVVIENIAEPGERRYVAYTVIKSVKETLIHMRRPIPPRLFELERRLVGPSSHA